MGWKERIMALMNAKGWTQKELAKNSGITEASVSRYLNGERKPRVDVMVNFAKALNVTLDFLMMEEENDINAFESISTVIARKGGQLSEGEKNRLIALIIACTGDNNVSKS